MNGKPNTDLTRATVGGGMYEAVRPYPTGDSTVARYAATAANQGFDGIVVRSAADDPAAYEPARIRDAYGIDVVEGTEIRTTDPSRASGLLGAHRRDTTVLLVRGGTAAMNRFAVRQDRVDVLVLPVDREADFEFALAGEAIDHDVNVALDLAGVLRRTGGTRVRAIDRLERLWRVIDDRDVPYVVTGSPTAHLELRAPRELVAVGALCGIDREAVEAGLRAWGRIAERNRDRRAGRVPSSGVEIVEEGETAEGTGQPDPDGEAEP